MTNSTNLVKPAKRKPPNAGKGRTKGSLNKATKNAKEAIARFVDGNAERLQEWLDRIAEEDGPKAAFMCFADLLEYHVPKLSRSEHVGEGGGPLVVEIIKPDV